MLYALGFIGLFTIGGMTGLFLASLGVDVHVTDSYFVIAHFHYIMVGGMVTAFMGGLHFWWPKITGRLYPKVWGKIAAATMFIGFNLTFFPQFVLGYLGMNRRYWQYDPQFQVLNVLSTAGASILGIGYLLPLAYFLWSLRYGAKANDNPWNAAGLEWTTSSPPIKHNFHQTPEVTPKPTTTKICHATLRFRGRPALSDTSLKLTGNEALNARSLHEQYAELDQQREAATLGMWVFLVTEVMFFGGMIMGYIAYRFAYPEAFREGSIHMLFMAGTINTAVLITASLFVAFAVHGAREGNRKLLVWCLLISMFLGICFLAIKGYEYHDHWVEHKVPGINFQWDGPDAPGMPNSSFVLYFFLTGFHALHMLIGVTVLRHHHLFRLERKIHARVPQSGRKRRLVLALRGHCLDFLVSDALFDRSPHL